LSEERQPIFNAPWPAVLATLVIVVGYGFQTLLPQQAVVQAFAFSAMALGAGRWETLFTAIFLHGSWAHALMNAGFALAFGTPVARYLGASVRGALVFLVFYLVCGGLGNLGFALVDQSPAYVVGASGAVAGLVGGGARIMGGRDGEPGPLFSPQVISMTIGWVVVNLLLALVGFAPGLGNAGVAWEAHIFGYAAGLFLIDPAGWLARPRRDAASERDH
jgi:membrane associated rhomboid family serine protease